MELPRTMTKGKKFWLFLRYRFKDEMVDAGILICLVIVTSPLLASILYFSSSFASNNGTPFSSSPCSATINKIFSSPSCFAPYLKLITILSYSFVILSEFLTIVNCEIILLTFDSSIFRGLAARPFSLK